MIGTEFLVDKSKEFRMLHLQENIIDNEIEMLINSKQENKTKINNLKQEIKKYMILSKIDGYEHSDLRFELTKEEELLVKNCEGDGLNMKNELKCSFCGKVGLQQKGSCYVCPLCRTILVMG